MKVKATRKLTYAVHGAHWV